MVSATNVSFNQRAAEVLKRAQGQRVWGVCASPVMVVRERHSRKMFEHIGANLCNLVHFGTSCSLRV